jgi:cytidine deaminase
MSSGLNIIRSDEGLCQSDIIKWLQDLRGRPHVPGSGYDVTNVFKARLGRKYYYFAGVNAENIDNRLSTHGEEGSISAMVTGLGKRAVIVEGWCMGAPDNFSPGDDTTFASDRAPSCGNCRQRIAGLAESKDMPMHGVSLNGGVTTYTIGELLPGAFSFHNLSPELAADKEAQEDIVSPSIEEVENRLMRNMANIEEDELFEWLCSLESVDFASKTSSAAIIKLSNGWHVAGVKTEDAAYTGTNAVQSALSIAVAEFGTAIIQAVWGFSKGRDNKSFPDNAAQPLPLSAIQVLNEFAESPDVPVTIFASNGKHVSTKLKDSSKYVLSFDSQYISL